MTSPRGPAPARLIALGLIALGLIALALIFALTATLGFPAAPAAEAGDGWWGALDEGEAVSLKNIIAGPRDFRGRTLTFFCLFHRKEKYFDPLRTQFSPKRYDNLSVWPDGAPVWEKRAYEDGDLPFVYIPRNHAQRDDLLQLEPFTRIEVTGRIRDLLRGRPTIEIFSFRVTGHRVGKRVIDDIMRGRNTARIGTKNGYQLAAQSLKRALIPDLAPLYAIAVRKMLAETLRKLGHSEEADAYDQGETYGTSVLPEPRPGERPRPSMGANSDLPGAPVWDQTGRTTGVGSPDGPPPTVLRGSPDGDDFPPAARPSTSPGRARTPASAPPGGAPPRTPLTRGSDLPGAPVVPLTTDGDLPGTPAATSAGASAPASRAAGAFPPPAAPLLPGTGLPGIGSRSPARSPAGTRPTPRSAEPIRRGPVSGIPPTRTSRLSGVR